MIADVVALVIELALVIVVNECIEVWYDWKCPKYKPFHLPMPTLEEGVDNHRRHSHHDNHDNCIAKIIYFKWKTN